MLSGYPEKTIIQLSVDGLTDLTGIYRLLMMHDPSHIIGYGRVYGVNNRVVAAFENAGITYVTLRKELVTKDVSNRKQTIKEQNGVIP